MTDDRTLTLIDALNLVARERERSTTLTIDLCCGFEPLHLRTFIEAEVLHRRGLRPQVRIGQFGDLRGNLHRAARGDADVVLLVIEWADLDPRLGVRSPGSLVSEDEPEALALCKVILERLALAIKEAAETKSIVVCGPTLPLDSQQYGSALSSFCAELQGQVLRLFEKLTAIDRVDVLSSHAIDRYSLSKERHDVRTELMAGFPYRVDHASLLAMLLVERALPSPNKKALITDLDNTLWAGIAGEDGPQEVHWSLDQGSQVHALYQQLLARLHAQGVLLGIATKNAPEVAREALARRDLHVQGDAFFPIAATWGSKAQSVTEILRVWNLDARDVVFIDDDPMELDVVAHTHPNLETHRFPRNDPDAIWSLLTRLRASFAPGPRTNADHLRSETIRAGAAFTQDMSKTDDNVAFLRKLEGRISFRTGGSVDIDRVNQLLAKTNQFNINGIRPEPLLAGSASGETLLADIEYADRYGQLGIIAAVVGTVSNDAIHIHHWVQSCRAFSRYIEHHTVRWLLRQAAGRPIRLDVQKTERNGPAMSFLAEVATCVDEGWTLTSTPHARQCPHTTNELDDG